MIDQRSCSTTINGCMNSCKIILKCHRKTSWNSLKLRKISSKASCLFHSVTVQKVAHFPQLSDLYPTFSILIYAQTYARLPLVLISLFVLLLKIRPLFAIICNCFNFLNAKTLIKHRLDSLLLDKNSFQIFFPLKS